MKEIKEKEIRINDNILEKVINVVTLEQKMLNNIDIESALNMAIDAGLDLVEVSPPNEKSLSICKIMDYGKIKYEKSKKKKSKTQVVKEIKYNLFISDHDLETKHNQILKFIDKGYYVKYIMQLKGRENEMKEDAILKFNNDLSRFDDTVSWSEPKVFGKLISTVLKHS